MRSRMIDPSEPIFISIYEKNGKTYINFYEKMGQFYTNIDGIHTIEIGTPCDADALDTRLEALESIQNVLEKIYGPE